MKDIFKNKWFWVVVIILLIYIFVAPPNFGDGDTPKTPYQKFRDKYFPKKKKPDQFANM